MRLSKLRSCLVCSRSRGRWCQRERREWYGHENSASQHTERERAGSRSANRRTIEDTRDSARKRAFRRCYAMRAEQQARAFVPRDTDQQLSVIRVGNVRGQDAVVGRLLTKLVGLARQQPDQRIEPEQGSRNSG